jgi:hypothetical protein
VDREPPEDAAARQARREQRQRGMVFGRVSSFEALEEADLEFWSRAPLAEKFQATLDLVRDSWYLEGNNGPVPRLDRRVGGVRKLLG